MKDMNATTFLSASNVLVAAIVLAVALLVLSVHDSVTSMEVPARVLADCPSAQVLDPVTLTCGGR